MTNSLQGAITIDFFLGRAGVHASQQQPGEGSQNYRGRQAWLLPAWRKFTRVSVSMSVSVCVFVFVS